jgi:hypothetical protein
MQFSSLEDAFGSPFGQRIPITETSQLGNKSESAVDPKEKHKDLIASVSGTLPLDTNPATESFSQQPTRLPEAPLDPRIPVHRADRVAIREKFTMGNLGGVSAGGGDDSKLDRILRLVEQNKTGYEPAATQDMLLYIATGVFFLFVFDTFVMLGKSMRGRG